MRFSSPGSPWPLLWRGEERRKKKLKFLLDSFSEKLPWGWEEICIVDCREHSPSQALEGDTAPVDVEVMSDWQGAD